MLSAAWAYEIRGHYEGLPIWKISQGPFKVYVRLADEEAVRAYISNLGDLDHEPGNARSSYLADEGARARP